MGSNSSSRVQDKTAEVQIYALRQEETKSSLFEAISRRDKLLEDRKGNKKI